MPIQVNLDVMLARRKLRSKDVAQRVGISEVNLSLLKSGKVKGVRFQTLARLCAVLRCDVGDLLAYLPGSDEGGGAPASATGDEGTVARLDVDI